MMINSQISSFARELSVLFLNFIGRSEKKNEGCGERLGIQL
jgi:hypothetical protein